MEWPLLTVVPNQPEDIVVARHRARQVAFLVGLDAASQTRLAAISELFGALRGWLDHARAVLWKATLTRAVMQRALAEVWPAGVSLSLGEAPG